MQCYYHSESPAVGVCKNCQRGICHECVAEVPNGIACTGRCEQHATSIGRTISENAHSILIMGFVFLAMGLMFDGLGVAYWVRYDDPDALLLGMGCLFILTGIVLIFRWITTKWAARRQSHAAPKQS